MYRATHLRSLWKNNVSVFHTRIAFRMLATGLGALHTYAAIQSQSMNADGISYLDIGDAYFRADWANAVNAVWSPLYSWILGLVNFVVKPSMSWEFPTVHIVNFLIFLAALASFEFMWGNVRTTVPDSENSIIHDLLWWTLGYLLFIWTSLGLIEIWSVTPDMLMATFVFLAAGLIARIRSGDDSLRLFPILGLILGLGYLAKTFMFSVALVFLVLAWLIQKWTWTALSRTLLAVAVFLLMSLPYIAVISQAKGKLTIGESGTVTYLRHVVGIPYPHWQGDPEHNIVPTHPSRVIHQSPPVYEFGEPIGGTYPISIDPSYWYEGIRVPISLNDLLIPLFASGMFYLELFFQKQGILVSCVLALYLMGHKQKRTFSEILYQWALVIPAIIAFGLYALVLVEARYIGAFVLLFWTDILANICLPNSQNNNLWMRVLTSLAAFGLLANIILFNLDGFARLNPFLKDSLVPTSTAPSAKPLAVAQTLQTLGIKQGDKVGVIGYAYDSFWARLAGVKIVAEMLEADAEDLWRGDDALERSILLSFAGAGVKAVVAENVPPYAHLTDWQQVGNSNYYIYIFSEK